MDSTRDTRNVTDEFKGKDHEVIVEALDRRGSKLEIAIENLERDFNMGTIVRTANALGVRRIHVIGRRQWNKRGAMKTDAYVTVQYHETPEAFTAYARETERIVVAIDIIDGARDLSSTSPQEHSILVFGSERSGISAQLLEMADDIVAIEQWGSTRSLNVGVAAGIAMYEWIRHERLG